MWFRAPADAERPPLVSKTAGISRIVARSQGSYDMAVTLLDSEDARLLRAGVVVAHRMIDGHGEWYVSAPLWPGLPNERSYELSPSSDLPEEVRERLDLFLREAPIAPLATVECVRRAFVLRDAEDEDIVEVRDDLITVIRDEKRSQTREIGMTPLRPLEPQQKDFVNSAMAAIQAVPIDRLPTLQQRIGPPATGLSSFREPQEIREDMSLEEFVSEKFVAHLGRFVLSELAGDLEVSAGELETIERDLRGLASVLEPESRAQLEADVRTVATTEGEDRRVVRRRILDALVNLVRAPKLGDLSGESARALLFSRVEQALAILLDRCRGLEPDSPDEAWSATLAAAEQLEMASSLLEPFFGKHLRRARQELDGLLYDLRGSVPPEEDVDVEHLSAQEAYQLGRDVENARWQVERSRARFVETWDERVPRVRRSLAKMRKRLS